MADEALKRTLLKGGVQGPGADTRAIKRPEPPNLNSKQYLQGVKDKLAQNRQTQLQKAMELLLTGNPDEHAAIHNTLKDVMKSMKGTEAKEDTSARDMAEELQKIVEKYRGGADAYANATIKDKKALSETLGIPERTKRLPMAGPRYGEGTQYLSPNPPSRGNRSIYDQIKFKAKNLQMPKNPIDLGGTRIQQPAAMAPYGNYQGTPQRPMSKGINSPTPMNY